MNCHRLATLALLVATPLLAQDESKLAHEVARKAMRPAGAPDYADVCFRYGWVRTDSFPTVDDARQAMADFHATRLDWFYPGSHTADAGGRYVTPEARAFIDWCKERDMQVVGTINTLTTHTGWKLRPWNDSKVRYVGDPAHPGFVEESIKRGRDQIEAGVDALVCDDFFKYEGAETRAFSDRVITAIKKLKPGFQIAGNSGHFLGTGYVQPYDFDFHYSDSNFLKTKPGPGVFWKASRDHRALNSALLTHPNRPLAKADRRKLIGLGYATGAHVIAPWDEFISGGPRLFAKPGDFSDLYAFARALGQEGLLNGHEDAAVGGFELKESRYGSSPPLAITGGSGKASAFARAQPGVATAPVAIHLVEWGEAQAFQLKLRPEAFFADGAIELSLRLPVAYEATAHAKAYGSKDYRALSQTRKIETRSEGDWLVAEIPALTPWGVLVVSGDRASRAIGRLDQDLERERKQSEERIRQGRAALPKVLIFGDSISGGYSKFLIEALEGKAEVIKLGAVATYRINEQAFWRGSGKSKSLDFGSAKACVADIDRFKEHLDEVRYDVIHFNFGLNDSFRGREGKWHNPVEQYAKDLDKIVQLLKTNGAKIIWSNTTPIPLNDPHRPAGDDLLYNAAAAKVMKAHGIPINDLHSVVTGWDGFETWNQGSDVHFNAAVSAMLARDIAEVIEAQLKKEP